LNSSSQGWFLPSLVKIGPVVLERKIFKISNPIFTFCDYLPFKEDWAIYLNNLEFPSSKYNLYQVWLNLASWFWRKFLNIFSVFLRFCYYLPLEKSYPLRLNKLESPPLKDDLWKVRLKLAKWFWRKRF
jgi:hypothetical protein